MLMPDPGFVRSLLSRYAELQMRCSERPDLKLRWQLDDVTYTLCVATGTRDIREALAVADRVLERSAQGTAAGDRSGGPAADAATP
ncbi:DUF5133 domain-containing protein [Streptomyces indicus]|uniref:DUF5133 domain-containing protein n=1 Tax=Streptomyces indicus TaxID=417292 RepID=A0A1G8T475_9ACTN|nr:DUF5133 domain-containing protein [Streptomyces indicus]SDJ36201.1 protein of unknown function [Streptomyces indicus]